MYRLTALLSKKISIPHALSWRVVNDFGLTAPLASFLTHVLSDDGGLEHFVYHGWKRDFGVEEVVYKELC